MKILGIIQARLNSTRLPRKIMKPLIGKPMLTHLVERCKRSSNLSEVMIACPITDFAEISRAVPGVPIYAAADINESDLISRFWSAASVSHANLVVRICSDNPCIDPANIDMLVQAFMEGGGNKAPMGTNLGDWEKTGWPQGLGAEIYSYDVLRWMFETIKDLEKREHPHRHFHEEGDVWEPECPLAWTGKERFEVNTPDDFDYMKTIFDHFGNNTFSSQDVLDYCCGEKQDVGQQRGA